MPLLYNKDHTANEHLKVFVMTDSAVRLIGRYQILELAFVYKALDTRLSPVAIKAEQLFWKTIMTQ
jgi:hypothetical protein